MPAQASIQRYLWIPAYAGMTVEWYAVPRLAYSAAAGAAFFSAARRFSVAA